jgi:uncharacterized protein with von Willebrand factor type A (vWA) domain
VADGAGVNLDAPYDRLPALPRALWLPTLVTSAGDRTQRLDHAPAWLAALQQGRLPEPARDFGDAEATAALRQVVGDLGLPALCHGVPALAEQVLRTMLWHLDRLADLQPRRTRAEAIVQVSAELRDAWATQTTGLEADLALLLGLGDLAHLRWDALRGHLNSRPWQVARQAADRLARMPALATLIRQLGRSERSLRAAPAAPPPDAAAAGRPQPLRAVETRIPDAPGEITGVHFSGRPDQMLPAEAVLLRHPVGARLWRARQAEGRLLAWQSEAVLSDWRPDPLARPQAAGTPPLPEVLERGPILLCLDTSGSMRGAPEHIAKAVVIAALRAAHEAGRACRLIAFGGPGEVVERDLGHGRAGLEALMDLMAQSFDGGTDLQTPIERALAAVHHAHWRCADLLIVSDGEFGCTPATLAQLEAARDRFGLRVQGVLVGDRETLGLLETCDAIHWVRDWRRHATAAEGERGGGGGPGFSPVHSKSLTALYFPNALSPQAARRATS